MDSASLNDKPIGVDGTSLSVSSPSSSFNQPGLREDDNDGIKPWPDYESPQIHKPSLPELDQDSRTTNTIGKSIRKKSSLKERYSNRATDEPNDSLSQTQIPHIKPRLTISDTFTPIPVEKPNYNNTRNLKSHRSKSDLSKQAPERGNQILGVDYDYQTDPFSNTTTNHSDNNLSSSLSTNKAAINSNPEISKKNTRTRSRQLSKDGNHLLNLNPTDRNNSRDSDHKRMTDQDQAEKLYNALRSLEKEQQQQQQQLQNGNTVGRNRSGSSKNNIELGDSVRTPPNHDSTFTSASNNPPPHIQLPPIATAGTTKSNLASSSSLSETKKELSDTVSSLPTTEVKEPTLRASRSHLREGFDEKRVASNNSNSNQTNNSKTTGSPSSSNHSLTLWGYLLLELGSQSSEVSTEEKTEQLENFVRLPFYLERVIIFGSLACFDSFLSIFTILPLRFCYAIYKLFLRVFHLKKGRIPVTRKADIIKGMNFLLVLYLLMQLDTSKIYHNIRGQSAIKHYVMFNVLEVADKLCSAVGQDILDCLLSANTLNISRRGNSVYNYIRPFIFVVLAIFYVYIHSIVILYQTITLNVAVNSYSNALLTLLLSNQFSEIKSTVFKKFERENLFQLTCADIAERFQITIMMLVIGIRNIVEVSSAGLVPRSWSGENRWLGALLGPMVVVVGSEVCVDWLKHAYIAKFNNIRPKVYRKFLDVLVYDYSDNSFSDQIMTKRIGIPIIPLASVFLRMLLQSYSMLVEHQQASAAASGATSSISYLPSCTITSFASSSLGNATRKTALDPSNNLSLSSLSTSLASSSLSNIAKSKDLSEYTGNSLTTIITTFFHSTVPKYFSKISQQSYYTCMYSSWKASLNSYFPESADSFYSSVFMALIVLISFILLFSIKLILGLFLLQYTSRRRAMIMAKSKISSSSSQSQSLPGNSQSLSKSEGNGNNNNNNNVINSSTTNIGGSSQVTVPATATATSTSASSATATRLRSASAIVNGSRRQSVGRHSCSAGSTAVPIPNSTKIPLLPVGNTITNSTAGNSTGVGPSNKTTTTTATTSSLSNQNPTTTTSLDLGNTNFTNNSGYESDESDHVPGPIKGQGLVEVNETVRERMYDTDEAVPPPKPRKSNIKDFQDLCKIQRFKMTAKQIW